MGRAAAPYRGLESTDASYAATTLQQPGTTCLKSLWEQLHLLEGS
jgi:hypothetical protein